jgi:ketosteroid isomerase-like protein
MSILRTGAIHMHKLISVLLIFTGCLIPLGCSPQANNAQMIGSAIALDQRFLHAFNRGDVDAVMATYWNSPDLIVYSPTIAEAHGWKAAHDALAEAMTGATGARLELTESHYQVAGEFVIAWGKWRMSIPSLDGFPFEIEGRYTNVKAQKKGKWVVILDHASIPWPLAR